MKDSTNERFDDLLLEMDNNAHGSSFNVTSAVGAFGDRQHLVKTLCLTCYEAGVLQGKREAKKTFNA